ILPIHDMGSVDATSNGWEVGRALLGPYVLAVALAYVLRVAGLVVAFQICREERAGEVLSRLLEDSDRRRTEDHA
ncbi:NADH-quinone oxidoreductase subunit J, partial [Klebsiella pneumoniae]|nr:NADH-quinone oxidoreductase subunit J [Klebsiella pneumoniae]